MFWCLELTLGGRQCMNKEYPPRAKTAIIENNREWNQSMDMEVNGTNQKGTYWIEDILRIQHTHSTFHIESSF